MSDAPLFDRPEPRPAPRPVTERPARTTRTTLTFTPAGQRSPWRIERWEELQARFQLGEPEAPDLWAALSAPPLKHLFTVVCRLYGMCPVVPGPEMEADDLRSWTLSELSDRMRLTADEVQAYLNAADTVWQAARKRAAAAPAPSLASAAGEEQLPFNEEAILSAAGFPLEIFNVQLEVKDEATGKLVKVPRKPDEVRLEKSWFARRVDDCRAMLAEAQANTTVRQLLMTELYLHRLEVDMARIAPSSAEFNALLTRKEKLEQSMGAMQEKLGEMFPDRATGSKVNFKQCLTDLVRGHQDYYARADNRLLDHIHTVHEVEFLLRQSRQVPVARLRLGQNVAIIDAINGLWDPNWRPRFKPSDLRKLDRAAQDAVEAVRRENDEPLIDLTGNDDWPDFQSLNGAEPGAPEKNPTT